jgi:hypothetical protein
MFRRFCRYTDKVFRLPALMAELRDERVCPHFSTQQAWGTVVSLLVTGRASLHAVEADRDRGHRPGTGPPSDDTLGRVFDLLDPEPVRQMLATINHQLKRNKALPLMSNLRFAAVDGHEFFSQ